MKVKIGATEYDVKVVDEDNLVKDYEGFGDDVADVNMCGFMCPAFNIIRIREDIPDKSRIHTFLHECVHAMLWEIGSELYSNEGFVESFAKQLYGFIDNNNLEKIYAQVGEKKDGRRN